MNSLLEKFQRDGFLVLDNFNSPEACDSLMVRSMELTREFDYVGEASIFQTKNQSVTTDDYFLASGENISFFFEKDAFDLNGSLKQDLFHSLNKIGHALHDLDPVFNQFSRSPQMKNLANDLNITSHVLIQSMMIFKHARIGGIVDIHQDSTFLFTEPDSCIGFWFALEDATIENGCLWAKPGGHSTALRERFRRKADGGTEMLKLNDDTLSTDGMIPLEVKKGACIVLHGRLPHYSMPNTSGKSRLAYAVHTIDKRAVYPSDNWLRRDMRMLKGF